MNENKQILIKKGKICNIFSCFKVPFELLHDSIEDVLREIFRFDLLFQLS